MKETEKKIQELTLNLLSVYIDCCETHNLTFFFLGGALIGVIRHQGFIPWDDDIDIGMPREDYDRFIELIKKNPPEGYGLCDRYTDPNWHFAMAQFIDNESEIEINLASKPRRAHIWLDIFPLDGTPPAKIKRWFHIKYILFLRHLVQIAHIETQVDSQRTRPWYEKAILTFCRIIPIGKLLSTDRLLDRIEEILHKYPYSESEFSGNLLGRYRGKEIVPTSWFGEGDTGPFEGKTVSIPADSNGYLTAIYGDYMTMPPEDKRDSHNVRIITARNI